MPTSRLPARTTLLGVLGGLRGRVRFEDESDFPEGPFVFNDSVSRDAIYALANRGGQVAFRGLLATPDSAGDAREVEATLSLHKVVRHDGRLSLEVRLERWWDAGETA